MPPDLDADIAAVAVGQAEVQQDEIRVDPVEQLQCRGGRISVDGLESGLLQCLRERFRGLGLIFDEEDPRS